MTTPADANFLHDQCAQLLTQCLGYLAARPAFTRSYVSNGAPAWDCEQIVTWSAGVRAARRPPGTETGRLQKAAVPVLDFGVQFLRCVTALGGDGEDPIPTTTVLGTEAESVNTDAWVLWREVLGGLLDGTLLPDIDCRSGRVASFLPVGPQGGLYGWTMMLEVGLA